MVYKKLFYLICFYVVYFLFFHIIANIILVFSSVRVGIWARPIGPKEIDGLLVPPDKGSTLLTVTAQILPTKVVQVKQAFLA